jgi:predicted RNase H-like HicB family nuclease
MPRVIALIHQSAGVFGISFPDFPGCLCSADSLDEALRRGSRALSRHVAAMVADGLAIPEPRPLAALRTDPDFAEDIAEAVRIVAVELPVPEPRPFVPAGAARIGLGWH